MVGGRGWRALAGVLAVASVVASCTADPGRPEQLDGWHTIGLPPSTVPSTLLVQDRWLLIGGQVQHDGNRSPALVRMPTDGVDSGPEPVAVTPMTPYGKVADLLSITGSGDGVVALGAARGGAHANARWTIWSGSVESLVDRPQTFETFGGWDSGTVVGVATDSRGPLVVGTWQGEYGLDGAVWRVDGDRWVRQQTPPALANTATQQVAPRTVSQLTGGAVAVNGSVIRLSDGVQQTAAYWRDVGGSWTLTQLADPGRRSDAWSTACAAECVSVGARDGAVAVWSGDRRLEIPVLAAEDTDSGWVLLRQDRVLAAVSSAGAGRLLIGHGDDWTVYTTLPGRVLAAELVGTQLYLVLGSAESAQLVVRDLADVLTG